MSRTHSLSPGDRIPALVTEPTEVQLFLFSAATWNSHRIHYDRPYATEVEDYPGILVQSHLHACLLSRAVSETFGEGSRLRRIRWQNRSPAVAGDRLEITGSVTGISESEQGHLYELELEETKADGSLCVKGSATVEVRSEEEDVNR